MERQAVELQEELAGLLKKAAEVSVALDRLKGTIRGVPHYSVIELRAHTLGQQLSTTPQRKGVEITPRRVDSPRDRRRRACIWPSPSPPTWSSI